MEKTTTNKNWGSNLRDVLVHVEVVPFPGRGVKRIRVTDTNNRPVSINHTEHSAILDQAVLYVESLHRDPNFEVPTRPVPFAGFIS